jgi:predicted nucleotidyltransferase
MFWLYNSNMARTRSLKKMLEILHQQIPMLAKRYSVEKLEVFGSYVRAEQKKDSNVEDGSVR